MAITHSAVVVVADDGTSPVGTDEWNAAHTTATVSLSGVSANKDQLLIPDTTAGAGLTIGADTNLYRSAANTLRTDDDLVVAGSTGAFLIGNTGVVGGIGYYLITQATTTKIQIGSGAGWTDGIALYPGAAEKMRVHSDGLRLVGTLFFTTDPDLNGDTNLYRSAANTLKTDDHFIVGAGLEVVEGAANVAISYPASQAMRITGGTDATNVYFDLGTVNFRDGSGGVTTTGGKISVQSTSTAKDQIVLPSTAAGAGITIGGDTNLYRSAADTLKTDDALIVVGQITQNAGKNVLDTESNVYIQDPGTFTIPTTGKLTQPVRLALSGTERMTDAGTGRATLSDAPTDPSALKYRSPGSVALTSDEYVTEYQRVELRGNSRKSMYGTGRAIVTGFEPVGRLVLSGRGGGS